MDPAIRPPHETSGADADPMPMQPTAEARVRSTVSIVYLKDVKIDGLIDCPREDYATPICVGRACFLALSRSKHPIIGPLKTPKRHLNYA